MIYLILDVELAIDASKNDARPGGKPKSSAIRYRHYTEMLARDDIDAVIVATPDHWHSRITIDVVGKQENMFIVKKGLTRTFQEAVDVYDTMKETGMILQLGHQNRQVEANDKAKQIIDQGLLGPVNLVELTTNRTPWGAWVWTIRKANRKTLDWDTLPRTLTK